MRPSTSPTLTALGREGKTNGVFFRTITSDALQGVAAAKFAIDQGMKKIVIIHQNNDFGVNLVKEFTAPYTALGGTIVSVTPYNAKQSDYSAEVTAAMAGEPDALYLISDPVDGATIARQWVSQGGVQKFLLNDGMNSDDFINASFDFFGRVMSGKQEQKPRWKRAMSVPNGTLSEAVGEMYVAKYFPEKDKARMLDMVKNLQTALGQHIAALDSMSDATKAKAQEKLAAFTVKIGYPDTWRDYSKLDIKRQSYVLNSVAAAEFEFQRGLNKLGKILMAERTRLQAATPAVTEEG